MKLTRDSALLTVLLFSALGVYAGSHYDLLTDAIPGLGDTWHARINLLTGALAVVAGVLRASPLPLNTKNEMAGTADPTNTLTITGKPKE